MGEGFAYSLAMLLRLILVLGSTVACASPSPSNLEAEVAPDVRIISEDVERFGYSFGL